MGKLDLKKEYKPLYSPSAKAPVEVKVPSLRYLMIDGRGNPNTSPAYAEAVSALYSLAYTLKFMIKKAGGQDYGVMPLQGLWWSDDPDAFTAGRKDDWQWTMMILLPDFVTARHVTEARAAAAGKKDLPALSRVRAEAYAEGAAAQILYLGPYSDEGPTIARLHAFIKDNGHALRGKHHEIYLSDPNRTAPEKLKTIIRQPFK